MIKEIFQDLYQADALKQLWLENALGLIKEKKPFKKIEFKVSNESAWEVGLACGGEIAIFLEQIN